jgi:pyruvate dehydrogenase E2 component (dihydrolipoamide acetyltransferase)
MAKISPTMESGQIVKWLVKVGDKVKEGDTLAEVQTDKAVMPMESFDEGTVARLDVAEGDEVPVGQRVLVLAKKGEDLKQAAEAAGGMKAQPAGSSKPAAEAPRPDQQEGDQGRVAHEGAEITNTPTRPELRPSAGNGQGRSAPGGGAASPVLEPASAGAGRVKSSPLARKVAAAANVDLKQVKPSGPGGRVVRRDVDAYVESKPAAPAAPARQAARTAAAQRIPLNRLRTTIAQRMSEAHKTAPDIHVTVDIRVDQLVTIRERLNQHLAADKIKLSLSDFVTKAVAMALRVHPGVNATFEDNTIVQYPEVNLGLAVAVEGGLIVPVLRNADLLGLREIRTGSETIFQAARQMKLTSDQMTGATFTISNLGMYGVRQFDAILNLPQVAILAVGAAEKRPIVVGDALAVGTVMTVTLTADHRAVDGAAAAEFLRTLKGLLEDPASMLL